MHPESRSLSFGSSPSIFPAGCNSAPSHDFVLRINSCLKVCLFSIYNKYTFELTTDIHFREEPFLTPSLWYYNQVALALIALSLKVSVFFRVDFFKWKYSFDEKEKTLDCMFLSSCRKILQFPEVSDNTLIHVNIKWQRGDQKSAIFPLPLLLALKPSC